MGKGSKPRPLSVSRSAYEENFDKIFSKKAEQQTITHVRIVSCKDPMRWYCDMIGQIVPVISDEGIEYKTRENSGYINFIQKDDCEPYQSC